MSNGGKVGTTNMIMKLLAQVLSSYFVLLKTSCFCCDGFSFKELPSVAQSSSRSISSIIIDDINEKNDWYSVRSHIFDFSAQSWQVNLREKVFGPLDKTAQSSSNERVELSITSLWTSISFLPSQTLSFSSDGQTSIKEEFRAENIPSPLRSEPWVDQFVQTSKKSSKIDKVKRVVDSSTVQLQNLGYVSLQNVRGAGSTYQLPECMTYAPSYKLKQLLPKGTEVRLVTADQAFGSTDGNEGVISSSTSSSTPQYWIVRTQDQMVVNRELVKSGYAYVRKGSAKINSNGFTRMIDELTEMERNARDQGLGIFKVCNDNGGSSNGETSSFIAEFEPLEFTTETQWGDDGGQTILVESKSPSTSSPPKNPGDSKGCSDFETYEDALAWYERYFPFYGDVAKLDPDKDGVPCPGLPHTSLREKYRMKIPNR